MKYRLTSQTIEHAGVTLHRIECIESFKGVNVGERGGFVEKESNLSQTCNAWVYDKAKVYGDAEVCGDAEVYGDAWVYGKKDYIVFKNSWSSGRYFTWTRSNDKWRVGCFYGSGEVLIKKAYSDSEESGRHYELYVQLVERLKKLDK